MTANLSPTRPPAPPLTAAALRLLLVTQARLDPAELGDWPAAWLTAPSLEAALPILSDTTCDAVLVYLPVSLSAQVENYQAHLQAAQSTLPIIYLIDAPDPSLRRRALNIGAQGVFARPEWPQVRWLAEIEQAGERRRYVQQALFEAEAAHEQMRLIQQVFETTAEGIFIADAESRILSVNPAFSEITGFSAEETIGRSVFDIHCEPNDSQFFRQLWTSLEVIGRWRGEIWNCRKNGERYPELLTLSTSRDQQGQPTHTIAVFTDISLRKAAEDQLRHLATHDPLTGLANREAFQDRLNTAIAYARRRRTRVAILLLDLDHFKEINDTLGHAQGDYVLQQVALRLQNVVVDPQAAARLGGDEFTLLLENITDLERVHTVAQQLLMHLAEPLLINGQPYTITASLGISLYPDLGEDPETLLRHADFAMYAAKQQHNAFQVYPAAASST
jgi:diguanylate cyclase (GGDEF)-like protein/PAS domain S-box-containing protein